MDTGTPAFSTVDELNAECRKAERTFLFDAEDPPTEEYAHFYFTGQHQGTEVIFNATLYTLRLMHESELYAEAEKQALEKFPEHSDRITDSDAETATENGHSDDQDPVTDEIGLFMAEVILELEEEEAIRVNEHVEIHDEVTVGVGLDIGLNVREVNQKVIEEFIRSFREGTLRLDPVLYTFQSGDDDAAAGSDDE